MPTLTHSANPSRRSILGRGLTLVILSYIPISALGQAHPSIRTIALRMWPAKDYTRVTLEFSADVVFRHHLLKKPDRLVVDVDGVRLDSTLTAMQHLLVPDDPYLKGFRAAQFTPQTIRLVLDLKQRVLPQIFSADPVGSYQYRFFIDLYPLEHEDPLLALLQLHGLGIDAKVNTSSKKSAKAAKKSNKKALEAPMIKRSTRPLIIALDAGHGGEDPGAIGPMGTYEKNVVLAIALRTKKRLEALGMLAPLTRDGDFFIPLSKRIKKARSFKADLFISIHADAFTRKEARGSSIYVVSDKGASSQAARWLAKKENGADKIGGLIRHRDATVARTLLDLTQSHTRNQSDRLAQKLLAELAKVNDLHKKKVEYANFAVLKAPDIPSALIETAFISNPTEERRLSTAQYQESIAQAIARGTHFFRQVMKS